MNLDRGTLLNNRYRIVDILGEGGMGAVYRAMDESLGVEVAVKENFFTSDEYARQFHREANILASLRHPNLPRVTDHFVIDNQGQYLVMDFMEGEDLRERIDRQGILGEEEVTVLGIAICEALTYMHDREPSVLHRDIKPGNVKVTPQGEVSLVDFGLAKIVEGDGETTPGARAMTPGYSPPEQYGTARTDPRTDIYSLGATLYEALTGAVPEDGLGRVMEQATLTSLRKRNPDISRRVAGVIEKALAVRPEDRFQSAEEFRKALIGVTRGATRKRVIDGGLTVSPPPSVNDEGMLDAVSISSLPAPESNGPFAVSAEFPLSDPLPAPRRRLRTFGVFVVLFLGLLLGGGAGAFIFLPDQASQAFAAIVPPGALGGIFGTIPSPTVPVVVMDFTNTPVIIEPTATATPTQPSPPTATTTPEPADLGTPSVNRTLEPILTNTPTPTITPTPLGGGTGEIAFASDRTGEPQIWIIGVDGTGLRRVTDMPDGACQPSWSPDGTQFVFISPCDQDREINQNASLFIINADGTGLIPLPTILGGDYDPDWSPDGKTIAFTSLRTDKPPTNLSPGPGDNGCCPALNRYRPRFSTLLVL